jgi:hypothetical protein
MSICQEIYCAFTCYASSNGIEVFFTCPNYKLDVTIDDVFMQKVMKSIDQIRSDIHSSHEHDERDDHEYNHVYNNNVRRIFNFYNLKGKCIKSIPYQLESYLDLTDMLSIDYSMIADQYPLLVYKHRIDHQISELYGDALTIEEVVTSATNCDDCMVSRTRIPFLCD